MKKRFSCLLLVFTIAFSLSYIPAQSGLAMERAEESTSDYQISTDQPSPPVNEASEQQAPQQTCCDLGTVASILDPRPYLCCPMTMQKAKYLTVVGAIVGGGVALNMTTGIDPLYPLKAFFDLPSLAIMAAIFGSEPLMLTTAMLSSTYPEPYELPEADEEAIAPTKPSPGAEDLAVIVACHNSTNEIEATVHALLQHLEPHQIFIIDNGNQEGPMDDTREKVRNISPDINYRWSPIGSKLIAQYAGCRAASKFKYILTIDDDVQLPKNFKFATNLIDDYTKGVAYPLKAIHTEEGQTSLLVEWQDIEYKLSDLIKLFESTYTTVLYPHGAVSLWERETFEKVLRKHDAVFNYDDVEIGTIARSMNKRIALAADSYVSTVVPTSFLGTPPNLYSQRVRLWEVGRHAFMARFCHALVCHWDASEFQTRPDGIKDGCLKVLKTIRANAVMKTTHLYTIYSNVADLIRVPALVYSISSPALRVTVPAYVAAMVIPVAAWNYGKLHNRPDLQSTLRGVLSFGCYKVSTMCFAIAGAYRTYTIYFFNKKHVETVPELEAKNDPRVIWDYKTSDSSGTSDGFVDSIPCLESPSHFSEYSWSSSDDWKNAEESQSQEDYHFVNTPSHSDVPNQLANPGADSDFDLITSPPGSAEASRNQPGTRLLDNGRGGARFAPRK